MFENIHVWFEEQKQNEYYSSGIDVFSFVNQNADRVYTAWSRSDVEKCLWAYFASARQKPVKCFLIHLYNMETTDQAVMTFKALVNETI